MGKKGKSKVQLDDFEPLITIEKLTWDSSGSPVLVGVVTNDPCLLGDLLEHPWFGSPSDEAAQARTIEPDTPSDEDLKNLKAELTNIEDHKANIASMARDSFVEWLAKQGVQLPEGETTMVTLVFLDS